MEVSDRFITVGADVPQGADGMQQPQKESSVSLEILKRLDYWHPCEVPTLLNLALSHVIACLPRQEEKPLEAPAEPFQRCFSRIPVIRYLASQQLLIPLLKRVPETLSMSKLQLSEFLNPEECLYLLQKFGKNLSLLYFYRPSLSIENLAKLAPNLTDIEVNQPLTADELRQLMKHYPNIQRIGPTALRAIDSATLRELLQTCTELTDLNYVPPHDMPTAHVSLKDIFSSSLRKLRISNVVEDAFGFVTRCPNLTSLAITTMDANDPLRTTLQQCSKLTVLSLPVFIKTDKMKTEDPNEGPTTPNFTIFEKITKAIGNVALIQKCFSVTFPNADIWMTLTGLEQQSTKTFFETKQNIRSITYDARNRASFHRCLELSGASLESIKLGGGLANDTDLDRIVTHCNKLVMLACSTPTFESAALIRLFEAVMLKKVHIVSDGNCNDKVLQSLLEKSRKSLVHLSLRSITNTSLHIIAQLGRGLKQLRLFNCSQISGADLVQLVSWIPNLKVAHFAAANLSNNDVALMSQKLPNLRHIALTVNDSFDIEKGWKCFSDDIAIEFRDKINSLIFQNEKANTKNPRNLKLKNGFVSFYDLRHGTFFRGYVKNYTSHHGKGKLINAAGITQEGDIQDGKLHGKGKLTVPGHSTHEGYFQDGKSHGKGKTIFANGDCHEGDYQEGEFHGKGKYTWLDGTFYEGAYHDGKMHGKGNFIRADGRAYEGDWQNGKPQGKGKLITANGDTFYEGDWQEGKQHGKGKLIADGETYEGDFQDGKSHGKGKLIMRNGDTYEGDWQNEKKHGKGKLIKSNGDAYEGDFQDGKFHGKGKLIKPNGEVYEGQWQNGVKHGKGKYTWVNGDSYEGDFQNRKFHGKGKYSWVNGKTYEGEWRNGMLHGFGILTFPGGRAYQVEHINDKLVKSLPCKPDGSDLKKQLDVKGEGKKSEEAESKGQKTSRSETCEEEEKPAGHPLKKRSRAEQETQKGQKMPRDFVDEDEETSLLQKRSRNQ